jgi:hypothetical protein
MLIPLGLLQSSITHITGFFGKSSIWHPHLKKCKISDKKDSEKGLF